MSVKFKTVVKNALSRCKLAMNIRRTSCATLFIRGEIQISVKMWDRNCDFHRWILTFPRHRGLTGEVKGTRTDTFKPSSNKMRKRKKKVRPRRACIKATWILSERFRGGKKPLLLLSYLVGIIMSCCHLQALKTMSKTEPLCSACGYVKWKPLHPVIIIRAIWSQRSFV